MLWKNRRVTFWLKWTMIAALFATLMTHLLWGYWFAPPAIAPLLSPMSDIHAISAYMLDVDASGQYVATSAENIPQWNFYDVDAYARPVLAARDHQIATFMPLDESVQRQVGQAIQAQDWHVFQADVLNAVLATRDGQNRCGTVGERYLCWGLPFGFVLQGTDEMGAPLVFISASSMNAVDGNDDHYYYYEALFEQTASGALMLRDSLTFAYDSAGVEFAQWPFWFVASWVMLLLGRLAYLTVRGAWWLIARPGRNQPQMA